MSKGQNYSPEAIARKLAKRRARRQNPGPFVCSQCAGTYSDVKSVSAHETRTHGGVSLTTEQRRNRLSAYLAQRTMPTGECLEWTGTRKNRYGFVSTTIGRDYAHRFAYEIAHGAIPAGLYVLHHCDNPPCVRPEHLFLGTHLDNMRDAVQKGRNSGFRKLTPEQVVAIRYGSDDAHSAGSRFGVSAHTVRAIRRRAIWKAVA